MSKKIVLTLIIIFFLIGAGFILFSAFKPTETNPEVSSDTIQNPFGSFFPDQNTPVTNTPQPNNDTTDEAEPVTPLISKLRKLSDIPIAGGVVFEKTTTTTSDISPVLFRYTERATGHIYEKTTTSDIPTRISNTTIPKIYESYFLEDKSRVIFRYLDKDNNIDTYVATVRATTTESGEPITNLEGVFMEKNIQSISVSPDNNNLFSLVKDLNTSTIAGLVGKTSQSANPNKQTALFNSPITAWISDWFGSDTVLLTTKASYAGQGVSYILNIKSGRQDKIVGPFFGLIAKASPNGKKIVYSRYDNGTTKMSLYKVSENITKSIPVVTLAEKCVWSKNNRDLYCAIPSTSLVGQYPDLWYMGITSFNDSIVKIDTELETFKTILTAGTMTSEPLDVINMQLSPKEDYLVFTNKRDLSFWSFDVKE